MTQRYFLISDIHASFDAFQTLLTKWNPETDILILMGDYIDRGDKNLDTLHHIMNLKETYGNDRVITLKGNHDAMFLDYIQTHNANNLKHRFNSYNRLLMIEMYDFDLKKMKKDSHKWRQRHVIYKHSDIIRFMLKLDLYYETEHFICVHAGLDLALPDWHITYDEDFFWIRDEFYANEKQAPKRTFFGHTPTPLIRNNHNGDIWMSPKQDKIGIDGGYTLGYQLNGIVIDEFGDVIEKHAIPFHEK